MSGIQGPRHLPLPLVPRTAAAAPRPRRRRLSLRRSVSAAAAANSSNVTPAAPPSLRPPSGAPASPLAWGWRRGPARSQGLPGALRGGG